jgi:FkbM family methyltransferase
MSRRLRRALYRMPLRAKQLIHWRPRDSERQRQIKRELGYLSWRDRQRVRRLRAGRGRASGPPVSVTVRSCGDLVVGLRPGTSDADVLWDTFVGEYHLPTIEPTKILDLGANIGLTAAHFAHRYPTATVVAVELDAELAGIARRHTQAWATRVEVVHAGVWSDDGEITYSIGFGEEFGAHIADGGAQTAPAVSMKTLLSDGAVDYVKMDIEGAEGVVLSKAVEWAGRVGEIAVEVHPPLSTVEGVRAALDDAGFRTGLIDAHFAAVRGTRTR